jgi:hypothetical protein
MKRPWPTRGCCTMEKKIKIDAKIGTAFERRQLWEFLRKSS